MIWRICGGILFCGFMLCSCTPGSEEKLQSSNGAERPRAKFEPQGDNCLLFVGQELEAIGGLDPYADGYLDHFRRPAGFTMYTNFHPGDTSFGYLQRGLDGIWSTDDWGDSPSNMMLQLSDPDFDNMALAIGLAMVGHEDAVARGERDYLVDSLGNWIKSLGERPVFLRIGYEFDGHGWNHYDIEAYKKAYIRIYDRFKALGVENVAYVWQSTGWVTSLELMEDWYPGDQYVDWCGYSFFNRWSEAVMIEFARQKGKPVFIAEATPTISDHTTKFDGDTKRTILSIQEDVDEAWAQWFVPFFQTIEDNKDIVKAVSYINCHWKEHVMWHENPTFRDVDARLHLNAGIAKKWKDMVYTDAFIHASEKIYDELR